MAIPTFDLNLCPPGEMDAPSILGGAVDGGRTLSGVVNRQSLTGGGLVSVAYRQIGLGNVEPAHLRYWNGIAGILNSGARSIIVPLLNDFTVPGGFTASLNLAARANDGTVSILLTGIRPGDTLPSMGDWFGVACPTKLNRAHVITDVDSVTDPSNGQAIVSVGIAPPIRENLPAGTPVNFNRPACLMCLAPGFRIKTTLQPANWATPDVEFVESFGST